MSLVDLQGPTLQTDSPGRAAEVNQSLPDFSLADREELFASLQPLVRRLVRQYGADPELRADLPGEIYTRFCDFLAMYDPNRGVPLKPYLINKLSASVYTYVRSQWRREKREVEYSPEIGGETSPGPAILAAEWERELLVAEVIRVLPEVIQLAPPRQRQVVIARFYEGRSFDDIAEQLNVRPATARSLLRHGLNRMRQHLHGLTQKKD
jgi:RNA polymerase sigma factor (sigma-70 family)